MNDVCQCKGCERGAICLGMCAKHYQRLKKYGSPFVTKMHVLQGLPPEKRFDRLHKKIEGGCWEWIGPVDQDGYGCFTASFNGVKYARAHRFSWAFHSLAPIPKGMMVCHSCDNPRCVNPEHLWLGDAADNNGDRARKGRHKDTIRLNAAILTEEQVRAILADHRPQAEIAHAYGVTGSTIGSIKQRKSWSHLEGVTVRKRRPGSGSGHRGKSDHITPDLVRQIRESTEQGKLWATRLGVSASLVSAIRNRRLWAHVE